ncbi:hypothetical protein SPLA10_PHROGS00082 [Salmonella phage SPLA10]|nr:hypothetical protein SPLA10_PHROGS00082 [Salmonella phage SPLA10]
MANTPEKPNLASIREQATGAMDSAKRLGQEATAKASSSVSIVSTSAKEALQAVDGFGKDVKDVLTESRNTVAGKIAEAKSWLTNTDIAGLGSLNDMLKTAADLKKEAEDLQKQINDTVSSGIGTVRGLTDEVLGPAEAALQSLRELPLDRITDGQYWMDMAIGTNASDLNNLGNLTTKLLGDVDGIKQGWKDQWGRLALGIGIADNAITLGDSTILNAIMDEYGTQAAMREPVIERFPDAVSQGNTALVKVMIDQLGADYILVKYPDAIQIILSTYRVPIGSTTNDEPVLGQELISILKSIDPAWDKPKTVRNAAHNLKVFSNASVDTQRCLVHVDGIGYLLRVSLNYSASDVLQTARVQYPMAGFSM